LNDKKIKVTIRKRDISESELIEDVKKIARMLSKDTLTADEYNAHGEYHSTTLTRRFGSWYKVLDLVDLKYSRSRLNIPIDILLENILNVWMIIGKQPSYGDMNRKDLSKFSAGTYENRFGSWSNALGEFSKFLANEDNLNLSKISFSNDTNERRTSRTINCGGLAS
jgi:hypothetical protein